MVHALPADQRVLVDEVRELIDHLVRATPRSDALDLAASVRAVNARFREAVEDDRGLPWYSRVPAAERATWFSPQEGVVGGAVYARYNPVATPLEFTHVGDDIRGSVVATTTFTGPPGRVHGGVIATMLDHVMGAWLFERDRPSFTVSMTVDYRAATPVNEEVVVRGGCERIDGRKTFMWGVIEHAGQVTARSRGVFVAIPDGMLPAPEQP